MSDKLTLFCERKYMRNHYCLGKLKSSKLGACEDKESIYLDISHPTLSTSPSQNIETLIDLERYLTVQHYYVAHNFVITKGKRRFFRGDLVKASKQDLVDFLEECKSTGDLRELLIAPILQSIDWHVIHVTDEALYLYKQ